MAGGMSGLALAWMQDTRGHSMSLSVDYCLMEATILENCEMIAILHLFVL